MSAWLTTTALSTKNARTKTVSTHAETLFVAAMRNAKLSSTKVSAIAQEACRVILLWHVQRSGAGVMMTAGAQKLAISLEALRPKRNVNLFAQEILVPREPLAPLRITVKLANVTIHYKETATLVAMKVR